MALIQYSYGVLFPVHIHRTVLNFFIGISNADQYNIRARFFDKSPDASVEKTKINGIQILNRTRQIRAKHFSKRLFNHQHAGAIDATSVFDSYQRLSAVQKCAIWIGGFQVRLRNQCIVEAALPVNAYAGNHKVEKTFLALIKHFKVFRVDPSPRIHTSPHR